VKITIKNVDDIEDYIEKVRANAEKAVRQIKNYPGPNAELLSKLRFEEMGWHPLEDRRINFVEQMNQTTTFLASLYAAKRLFQWHDKCEGLNMNMGAISGFDIESLSPNYIHAEVFASVQPSNNNKLRRDIERLKIKSKAQNKYVFFLFSCLRGKPPEQHGNRKRYSGLVCQHLGAVCTSS